MKFMGDYPSKQAHSSVEVTDQIFVAAIQEEVLRDEIYCQIMKQLTENRNRYLPGCKHLACAEPGGSSTGGEQGSLLHLCQGGSRGERWPCVGVTPFFLPCSRQGCGAHLSRALRSSDWQGQVTEQNCYLTPLNCCFAPMSSQCSSLCRTVRGRRGFWSFLTPKVACGENTALHGVLECFQQLHCQPSIYFVFPNDHNSLL